MPKRRSCQRKRKTKIHQVGNGGASSDRISNLPVDIIHKILCYVPYAAKISVLSQKWRSIWTSRPFIYLDESLFGANYFLYTERDKAKRDAFLTYAVKSFDSREECDDYSCAIAMVVLRMTVESSSFEFLLEKWLDFASKSKAKLLHLSLKTTYGLRFNLLDISFLSDGLLVLSIHDCEITNCSFLLPNLRAIFLRDVFIEDDDFGDLIAGCPRIQHLSIERPLFLKRIVVSNPNLIFFGVHLPCLASKIRIESANLESLRFSSTCLDKCEIEITSTATVRRLTLQNVYYYYQERPLINFINKFPLLEKLVIDGSWGNSHNLYVSHQHLTSFVVKVYNGVEKIRIDAPKLKSFEFIGGLTSFTGIKASQELKFVKFYLNPRELDARWYTWLRNLLKSFAHFKHLSLVCQNEQAIIFPDELTEILLPTINDLKNLKLQIYSSTATSQQILEGFSWILPRLKTLSLTLGSISKLIEFPERG